MSKRDLSDDLLRYVGMTAAIAEAADVLMGLADSYSTIQERWAGEEMSSATSSRVERREARLEQKITALVEALPQPTDDSPEQRGLGYWAVVFEGDPRGHTVAILPVWSGEDPLTMRRETSRWLGVDGRR